MKRNFSKVPLESSDHMKIRQINMQRWSITSQKPFDAVVAAVEERIGHPNLIEFVAKMAAATSYEEIHRRFAREGLELHA